MGQPIEEAQVIVTLIFISHSSADNASARHVADWLTSRGFRALFLDFDPALGIPAGRNWEEELYARLRQAVAVVFLSSTASLESPWCFAELALARAMGLRILPVRIERDARHPLLEDLQAVDLAREGEGALQRLASSLRLSGLDPTTMFDWDPMRLPYPGLRAFQPDDAAVFFGRETEINELIERLRSLFSRRSASLALVGPSGSGKSSLVHAGLLPRLNRLWDEWEVLPPVFPGDRPVAALARSLAKHPSTPFSLRSWRQLEERLRRHPGELLEVAGDLVEGGGHPGRLVLLIIDQAEELLTLTGSEAREDFIQVIGPAASSPGPLRVLFTVRSEFLSGLLQHPGMADLIRDSMAIGPLDRSRMSTVITGPAQRAGIVFQSGLVERMVEDAHGGDALPLLAYTLRQLCERRRPDAKISEADYEASGGVLGALRGQADRLLGDLNRAGRGDAVFPALVKLVTIGDGDEPTRRRLARRSLTPSESQVIDAFINAHLIVSDRVDDNPVVTLAHEALLRVWPPLTQAIENARGSLRQRAQLERMALDWEHAGRQPAYTLTGAQLAAAEHWSQLNTDELELIPLLKEFLQASVERQQSEAAEREQSEERMRRFIADAGHELRTPLTAIRGFAEYYRQRGGVVGHGDAGAAAEAVAGTGIGAGGLTPDDLDRIMQRVEKESARMGLLVEDVLLLARLDQQRPLARQPVDLLSLAADAVHDARLLAPDRVIELSVQPSGVPLVLGDEPRLRQIIGNLMSNALTHTPGGTPIEVLVGPGTLDPRADNPAPGVILDVTDHGPGMTPDHARRVFERFYRADTARTRSTGGAGLGLAIVNALVAAHGGVTSVKTAVGQGATFRITLPLAPPARGSHPANDVDEIDPQSR